MLSRGSCLPRFDQLLFVELASPEVSRHVQQLPGRALEQLDFQHNWLLQGYNSRKKKAVFALPDAAEGKVGE